MSRRFFDTASKLEGSYARSRKSNNMDEFSGQVYDIWDMIDLPGVTLAPNNMMSRPSFQRAANIAFNNMPPQMKATVDLAVKSMLKIMSGIVRNHNQRLVDSGKAGKGKSSGKTGTEPGKYFGE